MPTSERGPHLSIVSLQMEKHKCGGQNVSIEIFFSSPEPKAPGELIV